MRIIVRRPPAAGAPSAPPPEPGSSESAGFPLESQGRRDRARPGENSAASRIRGGSAPLALSRKGTIGGGDPIRKPWDRAGPIRRPSS
jgi:hypothetical protein